MEQGHYSLLKWRLKLEFLLLFLCEKWGPNKRIVGIVVILFNLAGVIRTQEWLEKN